MKSNYRYIAGLLIAIFLITTTVSMSLEGMTTDELPHLAAGFSYWKTFDFRLNPEHPPLVKLLAASPLLLTDLELPEDWESLIDAHLVGQQTFYNEDIYWTFFMARIPVILLGGLLGIMIYLLAKDMFGQKAALVSLGLFAFSPLMLAHSHYVTTDIGISCFTVMTLFFFRRYVKDSRRKDLIMTGVSLGFCLAAKFTGLYVLGIIGVLCIAITIIRHIKQKKRSISGYLKSKYTWHMAISGLLMMGIAAIILFASYGFIESDKYFTGLQMVTEHSSERGHHQYLLGMHSMEGWWYYFPVAFLLKTPIPTLILFSMTLLFYRRLKKDREDETLLIIPMVIYLLFFMTGKINIGIRHMMPIYTLLFIFVGRVVDLKIKYNKKEIIKPILFALGAWYIITSFSAFPEHIAYFNGFAGSNGHRYLIDSNIDWGQGLPFLDRYLEKNNIDEKIYLGYFGADNATLRGIDHKKVECFPQPGYVAASVNHIMNLYMEDPACLGWLDDYEPIDKAGKSIWIYHIPDNIDADGARQQYCDSFCLARCEENNMIFKSSRFEERCICRCLGTGPAQR